MEHEIEIDGRVFRVKVSPGGTAVVDGIPTVVAVGEAVVRGDAIWLKAHGRHVEARRVDAVERAAAVRAGHADAARAAMPGVVVAIDVAPGQTIAAGQRLLAVESMKLLSDVVAPRAGTIATLHVGVGEAFAKGAVLVTLEP